jgi:hypothetical protein
MSRTVKIVVLLIVYASTTLQAYSMGRQAAWHECHVEITALSKGLRKILAVQP